MQNIYHLYNSIKDWKEHRYNMKALQRQYAKTALKMKNNILENNSLNAVNTIDINSYINIHIKAISLRIVFIVIHRNIQYCKIHP